MAHDPRSEAEKARAALKRNDEMGTAVPESPLERQPSVTPDTFGDHTEKARTMAGIDGVAAGGPAPGTDNDPAAQGYGHADSRMGTMGSEALADAEQVVTGREDTRPVRDRTDADALTRAKE